MTSLITSHVLDASVGRPAAGMAIRLTGPTGEVVAEAVTDTDGRAGDLGPGVLPAGVYQLTFDTGAYFAARQVPTFYPSVTLTIGVDESTDDAPLHYHVPLLLAPFAYSTYRGS